MDGSNWALVLGLALTATTIASTLATLLEGGLRKSRLRSTLTKDADLLGKIPPDSLAAVRLRALIERSVLRLCQLEEPTQLRQLYIALAWIGVSVPVLATGLARILTSPEAVVTPLEWAVLSVGYIPMAVGTWRLLTYLKGRQRKNGS